MKRVLQIRDRKSAARRVAKEARHRASLIELETLKRRKADHDRAERMRTAGKPFMVPLLFDPGPIISLAALERLMEPPIRHAYIFRGA